ncbi:hypothetical protein EDB80DRAFT_700006, partial [Ilyonectria destructans]
MWVESPKTGTLLLSSGAFVIVRASRFHAAYNSIGDTLARHNGILSITRRDGRISDKSMLDSGLVTNPAAQWVTESGTG